MREFYFERIVLAMKKIRTTKGLPVLGESLETVFLKIALGLELVNAENAKLREELREALLKSK